jgi:hypothetical protein
MLKEKKKQTDYVILIDEKTRQLIQNKIPSDYVTEDHLKGFVQKFYFYEPKSDIFFKEQSDSLSYFMPEINTHNHNVLIGNQNPDEKMNTAENMLRKALYMVGRKEHLEECVEFLQRVYKNSDRDFILIRGITGSGKSLFLRKLMFEFCEKNKELKSKINIYPSSFYGTSANKNTTSYIKFYPFIFISYQTPHTYNDPMNGWCKILREIYTMLKNSDKNIKSNTKFKLGVEGVNIECDLIGEILFNSDCFSYVRYIEEILEISFSEHYKLPQDFTSGILSR